MGPKMQKKGSLKILKDVKVAKVNVRKTLRKERALEKPNVYQQLESNTKQRSTS